MDARGRREERRLTEIADRHGMVLLGPNCLGLTSPIHAGKFAGLLPEMIPGGIDFISGSGATVDVLAEQAVRRGLAFHTFVTVGNSAQTGVTDILALFDKEHGPHSSRHKMLYLEKLGSPAKLLWHARSLVEKGCILMAVKPGVTRDGSRAAASHTGAMVANDTAVQALLDKAGIIRLESKLDLVDVATALHLAKGHYNGRRVCFITDAGGPGVMATDELNRHGLETPPLKLETQEMLTELLPPGAGVGNPVDILPTRTPRQVARTLEIVSEKESDAVDYILIQLAAPGFEDNWPVYKAVVNAMEALPSPIMPSFATSISSAEALSKYRAAGKCHFEDEVSMARAVGRMVNRPRISSAAPDPSGYNRKEVTEILKGARGVVSPDLVRKVLQSAGIPVPRERRMKTSKQLAGLAWSIPPPWVMKVIGPLHKTDLGGVVADVNSSDAEDVFDHLMKISDARGVVVQETVQGPEVLMGLSREGDFGHLVAFGLGGVLAEALGDVRFGLSPLSPEEALRIIESIRAQAVLKGYRGRPGMNLDLLVDLLVRVSLLGRDIPGIKELDINPLKGVNSNLAAVDVRIVME
jgi:acetyltransferase